MTNIAIILAGGSGSRLSKDIPKQFMLVNGKQIIEYAIDTFEQCTRIDEICIVSKSDYLEHVKTLVQRNGYKKIKKVLAGGKERYDSSLAAINAYTDNSLNLLFHDAARPLVSERIINDCIDALNTYNAVNVAVKTTDTIIAVDDNGCIDFIPNRASLRNVQTPQCFKLGTIRKAYELAMKDPNFTATDDCGIVKHYLPQEPIFIVNGDYANIKITHKEDLIILQHLINEAI